MARVIPAALPRKLAKVPFVELADGRLQGVVSSGSDVRRAYVSSVAVGTYAYTCSTNNNRLCNGLRSTLCGHTVDLIDAAVSQYGGERVARYLKVDVTDAEPTPSIITTGIRAASPPQGDAAVAASVFSRFLRHLAYLDLVPVTAPVPEMQWFPPARAARTVA